MASPEISVVITFFREGALLRETVESALNQTFDDREVVLVDNNADSLTREIAQSYADRYPGTVRYVLEPLQGVAASKNRGLRESRGRFVAILDGDDLMAPERLALQRDAFLGTPGTSLASTWYDRVSMDNKTIVRANVSETEPSIWFETQEILRDLFPRGAGSGKGETLHFPLISTAFFERETALAAGGVRESLQPPLVRRHRIFPADVCPGRVCEGSPLPRSLPHLLSRGDGDQEKADGLGGPPAPERSLLPDPPGALRRPLSPHRRDFQKARRALAPAREREFPALPDWPGAGPPHAGAGSPGGPEFRGYLENVG